MEAEMPSDSVPLRDNAHLSRENCILPLLLAPLDPEEMKTYIHQSDVTGNTALILASCDGHLDMVLSLLDYLPMKDRKDYILQQKVNGNTALVDASQNGHLNVVTALLEALDKPEDRIACILHQTTDGCTALLAASLEGHVSIAAFLLDSLDPIQRKKYILHADVDGNSALLMAAVCGHAKVVTLLLGYMDDSESRKACILHQDVDDNTPLLLACLNAFRGIASSLLDALDIEDRREYILHQNSNGLSAFLAASQSLSHDLALPKMLLSYLPEVSDQKTCILQATEEGNNAMLSACECGNQSFLALFLDIFENEQERTEFLLHENNQGCTGLIIASQNGHVEAVSCLLNSLPIDKRSAYILHQDFGGTDALISAALAGHAAIITHLLSHLNPSERATLILQQHRDGLTALILASFKGHITYVSTLLDNLELSQRRAYILHRNTDGFTALLAACNLTNPTSTVLSMLSTLLRHLALTPSPQNSANSTNDGLDIRAQISQNYELHLSLRYVLIAFLIRKPRPSQFLKLLHLLPSNSSLSKSTTMNYFITLLESTDGLHKQLSAILCLLNELAIRDPSRMRKILVAIGLVKHNENKKNDDADDDDGSKSVRNSGTVHDNDTARRLAKSDTDALILLKSWCLVLFELCTARHETRKRMGTSMDKNKKRGSGSMEMRYQTSNVNWAAGREGGRHMELDMGRENLNGNTMNGMMDGEMHMKQEKSFEMNTFQRLEKPMLQFVLLWNELGHREQDSVDVTQTNSHTHTHHTHHTHPHSPTPSYTKDATDDLPSPHTHTSLEHNTQIVTETHLQSLIKTSTDPAIDTITLESLELNTKILQSPHESLEHNTKIPTEAHALSPLHTSTDPAIDTHTSTSLEQDTNIPTQTHIQSPSHTSSDPAIDTQTYTPTPTHAQTHTHTHPDLDTNDTKIPTQSKIPTQTPAQSSVHTSTDLSFDIEPGTQTHTPPTPMNTHMDTHRSADHSTASSSTSIKRTPSSSWLYHLFWKNNHEIYAHCYHHDKELSKIIAQISQL